MMPFPWFAPRTANPSHQYQDPRLEPIEPADDIDRMVNESLDHGKLHRQ